MIPDDKCSPALLSLIRRSAGKGGKVFGVNCSLMGRPVVGSKLNSGEIQGKSDMSFSISCPLSKMTVDSFGWGSCPL